VGVRWVGWQRHRHTHTHTHIVTAILSWLCLPPCGIYVGIVLTLNMQQTPVLSIDNSGFKFQGLGFRVLVTHLVPPAAPVLRCVT
jgi:hypothetical protein